MTTSAPLPDDLSRWPADAFALLGLPSSVDAKQAKRAYLALVRHYKPEHEPEKFQRLRQALEQVQRQIELREKYAGYWDDVDEPDEKGNPDPPVTVPKSESWDDPVVLASSYYSLEEELDDLWRAACRGEEARAYAAMQRHRHVAHASANVYARLYWLLHADRTLDPARSPCEWLVEGLRGGGLAGPLRELYRRELAASSLEAASARCASLLEAAASPGALADLLEWRWRGVSQLGRWDLILEDLRRVRPKIVFDDEETWGRLLLLAMDHLAWFEQPEVRPIFDGCRQELDQLAHLHARLGDDYDRLDLLLDVVAGWQRLRFAADVPAWWTSLVPLSWCQPPEMLRTRFAPLLKSLGEHPMSGLQTFDALARHSKAAAAQLGQSLERLRYSERPYDDRRDDEAMQQAMRRFLLRTRASYQGSRDRLLELCLAEAIDPLWIGRVADEHLLANRANDESWTDALAADGPLRYVYLGYRAYWG